MSDEAIPGGLNEDDLATLSTPTADTPMTDHAEQHSALTDLMKEASDEFVYQDMELTQLDAEVEDIADFLGGIDFTVNYGNATYTYDSRNENPESGHFWSDKTGFAVRENHYKFNKVDSGMSDLEWDKAIVGDTLNIVEKGNAEDFGTYLITEIIDDGYYNFKVVMTAGNHALNSGGKYDCSVTHKEKQFSSGYAHTHDLTEEQIAENRKDIDDIVDYLDGEDDTIPLSSAAWMQNNTQPPPSEGMWSDNTDFTKTTQVMMTRTANGGVKPNWDVAREGDELYLQVDYAYTSNHGKFTINKFEITDGDQNPDPKGDYYYMEVEPKSGNMGGAQAGQYTSGHITHYGLSFPEDSVSGEEIDLSHEHDEYLEKTGGQINGKLTWPYSQKEALSFHTNSKGEPKQLTFGTTSNYWEHVWEGSSHQKMKWKLDGNDAMTISGDELDMHGNTIKGVKDPTSDSHAANKRYVDNAVSLGTAGISTASVGDNALILTDKLNQIDERLEGLEGSESEDTEHQHEELENKVSDLEDGVDTNTKAIQKLAGSLADTMEPVTLVNNRDWNYAGEGKNPRTKQFSTDSWYFGQAKVLNIHKTDLNEGQHDWKDIVMGDEVTIRYNADPDQPVNERYFGQYLVSDIVSKKGDTLTVGITPIDFMGTIVDDRKYSINIRGTRAVSTTEKIEKLEKQVAELNEEIQKTPKVIQWTYMGYGVDPAELEKGEFTVWVESNDLIIRMHRYDKLGKYWAWNQNKTHPLGDPIVITDPAVGGVIYIADGVELKTLQGSNPNFYCEVKGSGQKSLGTLNSRRDYIIDVPGLLPQFATPAAFKMSDIDEVESGE